MSDVPTLLTLHVSPWSERARWALDHHRIAYRQEAHVPVLGERKLRRIVGPSKPRATVPVLVTRDGVIDDSSDIALYADRIGTGTKLVPDRHRDEIERWVKKVDDAMGVARALILAKTLASPGALDEATPMVPNWLRPLLRPIARRATRAFVKKYALELGERDAQVAAVRAILVELRRALGGRDTMLGEITYADVAAATLMQGIAPVDDRRIRLLPATRAVWTQDDLAREFSDLVLWRDRLYDAHRGSRVRA